MMRKFMVSITTLIVTSLFVSSTAQGSTSLKIRPERFIYPTEGQDFAIECFVNEFDGKATFTLNDNSEIGNSTDGHRYVVVTKVGKKQNLTMVWNPIRAEDIKEMSEISCFAGKKAHSYNIVVLPEKTEINLQPSAPFYAVEGSKVSMNCTVSATIHSSGLELSITWRHKELKQEDIRNVNIQEQSIQKGQTITLHSTLTRNGIREQDKGMYFCVAVLKGRTGQKKEWEFVKNVSITDVLRSGSYTSRPSALLLCAVVVIWLLTYKE